MQTCLHLPHLNRTCLLQYKENWSCNLRTLPMHGYQTFIVSLYLSFGTISAHLLGNCTLSRNSSLWRRTSQLNPFHTLKGCPSPSLLYHSTTSLAFSSQSTWAFYLHCLSSFPPPFSKLLIVASTQFSIKVYLGRVTMTFIVSLVSMGTSQSLSHSITGQYLSLLITPLSFKTCFILGLGDSGQSLTFPYLSGCHLSSPHFSYTWH